MDVFSVHGARYFERRDAILASWLSLSRIWFVIGCAFGMATKKRAETKPTSDVSNVSKVSVEPADPSTTINAFKIRQSTLAKLDAWLVEQNQGRRGPKLTRTDLMRAVLDWASDKKPNWAEL